MNPRNRKLTEVRGIESVQEMVFRLTYEGPLPSDARERTEQRRHSVCQIKHEIRKKLHPQLKDLCERTPALKDLAQNIRGRRPPLPHLRPPDIRPRGGGFVGLIQDSQITGAFSEFNRRMDQMYPNYASIGDKYKLSGFEFVPLVIGATHTVCHVDVLFLRREKPDSLLTRPRDEYGGDLDNRIKIFIDALRVPRESAEVPKDATVADGETPFYCLLEDDSLITRFQVESDALLGPATPETQTNVSLIARITTLVTQITPSNWDLAL